MNGIDSPHQIIMSGAARLAIHVGQKLARRK
jgi:hypothetical protein